jgi:hypothetical protein
VHTLPEGNEIDLPHSLCTQLYAEIVLIHLSVLEVMINQAKDRIKDAESNYSATCLKHAGMHEVLEEWQPALDLYLDGVKFCEKKVEEARKDVEDAKIATANDRRAVENGKTSEVEVKNADSEKKQSILSVARNRLSNCLLMLHRFLFYAAGMYHELKDEENESKLYDRAEEIRRENLHHSENKVMYLHIEHSSDTFFNSHTKCEFFCAHNSLNLLLRILRKVLRQYSAIQPWNLLPASTMLE